MKTTDTIPFPQKLRSGELTLGLISFAQSEVIIEAMAAAGMDFVIIDTEHSPSSLETVARLIRAADAAGIAPLVRFADVDKRQIQVALDAGAAGIVISNLETAEQARALVRATQFRPLGDRGVCPMARTGGFAAERWQDVMAEQNAAIVTIGLIESAAGLEQVEEISAVEGLDAIFMGPGDLSVSLGIPYQDWTHPTMREALLRAIRAANDNGIRVVTSLAQRIDHEYGASLADLGVTVFSYSTDNMIFYTACREIVGLRDRGPSAALAK